MEHGGLLNKTRRIPVIVYDGICTISEPMLHFVFFTFSMAVVGIIRLKSEEEGLS